MPNKRPVNLPKRLGRFLFAFLPFFILQTDLQAFDDDNFFIKGNSEVRFALRPITENWLESPVVALANAEAGLWASDNLFFSLTALSRLPIRSHGPHAQAFVDLGDSYLKYTHPKFVLSLGQLRLPWRTLRGAAFSDRVNPIDYRRGYTFSTTLNSFVPQWGAAVSTDLFGWTMQGAYFFWHRGDPSSLISEEQDGVQIARYQGSLAKTRNEFEALFQNGVSRSDRGWFVEPKVALRVSKLLGDVNLALSYLWSFDDVPFVSTEGSLSSKRAMSFGAESSVSLGIAILKAEAVVTPRIGNDIGKVSILRSGSLLFSETLTNAQFGIGLDAQYGDGFSGSLELIETMWFDVPQNSYLHAIESPLSATGEERFAQRIAMGLVIGGKALEDSLSWTIRGEMGLNRWDLLSNFDVQYSIGETGFNVGTFASLFFGVENSPGWFRMPATEFGLKAVYNL